MPIQPQSPLNQNTTERVDMGAEAVPHLIFERQLEAAAAGDEVPEPQGNVDTEVKPEQPEDPKQDDG